MAMNTGIMEIRQSSAASPLLPDRDLPRDGLPGLWENWRTDLVSGFILSLIALPLSLGIAMASGVPPIAGVIGAIVGGVVVSLISGSHVTINGPAAGLIVVVLCSVERLGGGVGGYRCTLAAIVVAGMLLLLSGLLRAGALAKFFPPAVVHGMLAAIGLIIISKQLPYVLGVAPVASEPIKLILAIPAMFMHLNPVIAAIGFISLVLLIVHGQSQQGILKRIPAPIIVVLFGVALGCSCGLGQAHTYEFIGFQHSISPQRCLVALPGNLVQGLTTPDFSRCGTFAFWLSVFSITVVQGMESLLSCAAIDTLDPYRRRSNLSRDLSAVGIGSIVSGALGGLPVIAEIVRSTANVANGARSRWSNFFHGCFILLFVLFAAALINRIPLASLAALLVVTGYKLSSARVFHEIWSKGIEETIVFAVTIVTTLASDLLIGLSVGLFMQLLLRWRLRPVLALKTSRISRSIAGQ